MFWLAGEKLAHGAEVLWTSGSEAAGEITSAVMGAIDACLFGIVLVIFAFAIAFGFVLQPTGEAAARVPEWMRIQSIKELKITLVEVIIVYLVVDFATDIAAGERTLEWQALVKPASIVLIALALQFMGAHSAPKHASPSAGSAPKAL